MMSDNNFDEPDLPSHTVAMRCALNDCENALAQLFGSDIICDAADSNNHTKSRLEKWATRVLLRGASCKSIREVARDAAESIERQRQDALADFRTKWDNLNDSYSRQCPVDAVRIVETAATDSDSAKEATGSMSKNEIILSPLEFKQRYVYGNIPCIIRGLDDLEADAFHFVTKSWRNSENIHLGSRDSCANERRIGDDWFIENVGQNTIVQVRRPLHPKETDKLDEEGRAEECETTDMTMQQWIEYCRVARKDDSLYLKDWHLVHHLEKHGHTKVSHKVTQKGGRPSQQAVDDSPLYSVPSIFCQDVLNAFLLRYLGGDFRFTYWGPSGSSTTLHSDVLHTFSWSFNVVGEKEWLFYPPVLLKGDNGDAKIQYDGETPNFVLSQGEGDAVFVPSGWRHEVKNVRETLSINHNWFTAASVDRIWECIRTEIMAVEKEAMAWGIPANDWAAKENMLRGCIGLDVTMFFLALVLALVDDLCELSLDGCYDGASIWESLFNAKRLSNQFDAMMLQNEENISVELFERLCASLGSQALGQKALFLAKIAVGACQYLFTL